MEIKAQLNLIKQANAENAAAVEQALLAVKASEERLKLRSKREGVAVDDLQPDGFDMLTAFLVMNWQAQRETNLLLRALFAQGHEHGPDCGDPEGLDNAPSSGSGFVVLDPQQDEKLMNFFDKLFEAIEQEPASSEADVEQEEVDANSDA